MRLFQIAIFIFIFIPEEETIWLVAGGAVFVEHVSLLDKTKEVIKVGLIFGFEPSFSINVESLVVLSDVSKEGLLP